jgi:hypothetical protein
VKSNRAKKESGMYPRTHTVLVLLTLASFAGNALAVEPAPLLIAV